MQRALDLLDDHLVGAAHEDCHLERVGIWGLCLGIITKGSSRFAPRTKITTLRGWECGAHVWELWPTGVHGLRFKVEV